MARTDLELRADQLRRRCDPSQLTFTDTSQVLPLAGIIGQDKAVKALEFGLDVPYKGYNIFVSGHSGTGRSTLAQEMARKKASERSAPVDWCYVYNFTEPEKPTAIGLPAGIGKHLVRDIDNTLNKVRQVLAKALSGEDFEIERNRILAEFYEQTSRMYLEVEESSKKLGFTITRNQNGIATVPLVEGRQVTPDEYTTIDEKEKVDMVERGRMVQEKINDAVHKYKELEKDLKEKLRLLEQETARAAIAPHFAALYDNYRQYRKVITYLEDMQSDIVVSLEHFVEPDDNQLQLAFFRNLDKRHLMRKYKVNLLVDNSEQKAAPVITETNPNYANLFGSVEYEGEFGVLSTDFTKIRPGAIHKANGGYLILNFMDVISNLMAWETLKRVLKNGEVTIESIMKSLSIGGGEALQPEAIPVEVKVILIGEPMIYYLLYTRDEDFAKLFKIKAEFDSEMERSDNHVMEYASFINRICVEEGLPHFSREAVARVVDHGTWLADDQNKLCTTFNRLRDIIYEASVCAARNEKKVVEAPDVEQAIREKVERSNMVEERLMEAIEDGTILLEITGSRVGELNGLAVYSIGDYMFGKPSRITAKTFMGEKGLVNIEREVRMSGNIHNKGILTLSGYLGDKYAQDKPLSLSASVTFEQTYEGIEGDSASSTELFAIISSLSGLPINQGIAVTGSVNQNGEIQPIGGVNQKIEGFFRVCRIKGLTGNQGVMIPRRNVRNLMLNQEIVDMVKVGRFHIWAINTVDEGIEILMNTPAGTLGSNGQYDRASVHYQVNRRLRELGDLKQLDRRRLQADSVTKRINNRRV